MGNWLSVKNKPNRYIDLDNEYVNCINDLISHEKVMQMKKYIQHREISCLEHTLYVSYCSFLICRKIGLDCNSAARGGLLHDFFLYDWHDGNPYKGLHAFTHSKIALKNANKYFSLNAIEKDIIGKHMWPLTITPPKYLEAYVVLLVDKFCTIMECTQLRKRRSVKRLEYLLACSL